MQICLIIIIVIDLWSAQNFLKIFNSLNIVCVWCFSSLWTTDFDNLFNNNNLYIMFAGGENRLSATIAHDMFLNLDQGLQKA